MNSYKYFLKLIMSQQIQVSVDSNLLTKLNKQTAEQPEVSNLPAVSKNIIDKGRKSICVTVSLTLRTYMYSQLIYLHFGGSYTSFTQLKAEIHALEYKSASNTGPFSLLFLIPKMTYYFRMFFTLICLIILGLGDIEHIPQVKGHQNQK